MEFSKDLQYYKFGVYGFLKNLRFFEPFLIFFFLEKDLSFLQIGTLYAIREVSTNILEIPSGFLADILGRRRTMITSFLFYIGSFLLFYYSDGYWSIAAAMFFYSIGEAFRTGVHKAMIFTYLQLKGWAKQKVAYYGHTRSFSLMGSALSALIAAIIVFSYQDYQAIFLFSTVPYILDLILLASYPKELDGVQKTRSFTEFKASIQELIRSFLDTFKNQKTLRVANSLSIYDGYYKSIKDYLQPIVETLAISLPFLIHLEEEQRNALIIGQVYFFIYLFNAIASRNAGRIADLFQEMRSPLNISLLLGFSTGLVIGCLHYFGWTILPIFLFLGIHLVQNIRKPMGISLFADRVEDRIMATALSAQNQMKTLWAAIVAILIGTLIDFMGLGAALACTSLALLLLVPLFWLEED